MMKNKIKKRHIIIAIITVLVATTGVSAMYLSGGEGLQGFLRINRTRSIKRTVPQKTVPKREKHVEKSTSANWWCKSTDSGEYSWQDKTQMGNIFVKPAGEGSGSYRSEKQSGLTRDYTEGKEIKHDNSDAYENFNTRKTIIPFSVTAVTPGGGGDNTGVLEGGNSGGNTGGITGGGNIPVDNPDDNSSDGSNKKYSTYVCGCDDSTKYISELSQTFECPDYGNFILLVNTDNLRVVLKAVDKYECECSCGKGLNYDWDMIYSRCDQKEEITNKYCSPELYKQKSIPSECSCFENLLKKNKSLDDYLKNNGCPTKEECEEYKQALNEGNFTDEFKNVKYGLVKNICNGL